MILVTLGTQDKSFERLLKQIDKEISLGHITERVVVQAGCTKYESKNMEIFDLISPEELDKLIDECRILITHGGVGSILSAIKKDKVVIAAARLKKYREHTNDHQKQIVGEFAKRGYILELRDFNSLGKLLKKAETFKPKKYISNTANMVKLISDYIEEDNHTSWYNKSRQFISYIFFGVLTTVVNILSFYLLDKLGINTYISNLVAWIISVLFAFITNKLFVFDSKSMQKKVVFKEFLSFVVARILSLGVDMGGMFLLYGVLTIHKIISKIIVNIIVIVMNYVFSKLFIFKNKSSKG